jgi:iron complex outermembrane receptor protein
MRLTELCAGVRWGLLIGVAVAASAPPAYADDATASVARNARVRVITRAELEHAGYVTIADVLQRLAWAGQAANPLFNGGGNGEHWIDLRDIGAVRTLVLVDGRRWMPGLEGPVDLTAIPFAAVERIEITPVGDGARDGSGAIAGTINIVLRARHDGAQARAWLGEYDAGDGRAQHYELTIGSGSERADVVVVTSYAKQEPVRAADRAISAVPRVGFDPSSVLQGASSTTPFGRFDGPGIPGTVVLTPGEDGRERSDFRPFDPARDGYNVAPDNHVLTPSERLSVYARARYALSDAIGFSTTALYNERRSQIRFAPVPLTLGTAFGFPPTEFNVPAGNVFNPFGVEINRVQFRNVRAPRTFDEDVDTLHVAAGFDGTLEPFGREFAWNAYASYTDAEQGETARGFFDHTRLRLGLGPSFRDASGTPVCGTPTAPIAGCVPINVFGGPAGFTQAMYDYAAVTLRRASAIDQTAFAGSLRGAVFDLPAGAVHGAAGYEHRRVSGSFAPDAFAVAGLAGGFEPPGFAGGYAVDEAHVAFDVPLLAGAPLAHALDAGLAARYVDYAFDDPGVAAPDPRAPFALAAGDDDNTLFGASLRWAPVETLAVQVGYADGTRLPSLAESARGGAMSFSNERDPCAQSLRATLPAVVAQRCLAGFGGLPPVPADYEPNSASHPFATGGNPALTPERAHTVHAALTWQPTAWRGSAFGVAWQRTDVTDRVVFQDETDVLERCYVQGDLDFCRNVRRDAFGQATAFVGDYNLGRLEVESYDAFASHGADTAYGAFDVRLDATYLADYATDGAARNVGEYDAGTPLRRLRANLATTWRRGDLAAHLATRYRSGVDEACPDPTGRPDLCAAAPTPANPRGQRRVGSTTYVDLQVDWDAPWDGRVSAGVRNAFDRDPPVTYSVEGNFPRDAEVPGRLFYVAYTQAF